MMEQTGGGTGLPADRSYLECGLPDFLRESIAQMQAAWDRLDRGREGFALGLRLLQFADGHQQCGGQPGHQFGAGVVSPGEVSADGEVVRISSCWLVELIARKGVLS